MLSLSVSSAGNKLNLEKLPLVWYSNNMNQRLSPDFSILPPQEGNAYTDDDFERSIEEGEISRAQAEYMKTHGEEPAPEFEEPQPIPPDAGPGLERRSEPRFSRKRSPRTWRDRMAADQAPPHMRRPQPGDD